MPECTNQDLRKAREAREDMPRWKLGSLIGVSESTIERWERGEVLPTPDDVDRIGEAVGDPTLWHRWMLSNVESYRRRYSETRNLSLPVAIMSVGHLVDDMRALQDEAERDAIDGKIDDPKTRIGYEQTLKSMIARCTDVLNQLGKGGTNDAGSP